MRPNFRHFPQRFICSSPQLGQRNFVVSVPGWMGLPQLVHVTRDNVVLSVIKLISVTRFVIVRLPYICYACWFYKFSLVVVHIEILGHRLFISPKKFFAFFFNDPIGLLKIILVAKTDRLLWIPQNEYILHREKFILSYR